MKKFVFVLMPFNDDFNSIYQYGIKAACQAENIYCERVDEQYFEGSILDRIYNQIQCADFIVADMSTRSPNVFYEVGYAHAIQKKMILITQNEHDIPFDLKHYSHIIYDKNKLEELKFKLSSRLHAYLTSDKTMDNRSEVEIQAYISQVQLSEQERSSIPLEVQTKYVNDNGFINITPYYTFRYYNAFKREFQLAYSLSVLLKNETNRVFDNDDTGISIFFSDMFPISTDKQKVIRIPDKRILLTEFFSRGKIYPHSYWERQIYLETLHFKDNDTMDSFLGTAHTGEIQINAPYSQKQYQFELRFKIREKL